MSASVGEHARVQSGTLIGGRFSVIREMGCGNFAKVYCCRDTQCSSSAASDLVAVKVLKREYANDARYEANILKVITEQNGDESQSLLTMKEQLTWGRYPVFVFPLKGPTLRQCKLGVSRGCVSSSDVRYFAYEMLQALSFLHFGLKIIHTDLKPENILLSNSQCEAGAGIGQKWTIADFGSASFYRPDKLDNDLISTRPYRAPEVVLGSAWYYPADTWSMACIIFEVYSGQRLFDVHDDTTHLWQMERRLGPLPESLTSGQRYSRRFFDSGRLLARVPSSPLRSMADVLRDEPQLHDLLAALLAYDPSQRLRADAALEHPYFDGIGCRSRRSPPAAAVEGAVPPTAAGKATAKVASSVAVPAAAPRALPHSRAASPMLPTVSTNSYEVLKYAKYRRGLMHNSAAPSTLAEAAR